MSECNNPTYYPVILSSVDGECILTEYNLSSTTTGNIWNAISDVMMWCCPFWYVDAPIAVPGSTPPTPPPSLPPYYLVPSHPDPKETTHIWLSLSGGVGAQGGTTPGYLPLGGAPEPGGGGFQGNTTVIDFGNFLGNFHENSPDWVGINPEGKPLMYLEIGSEVNQDDTPHKYVYAISGMTSATDGTNTYYELSTVSSLTTAHYASSIPTEWNNDNTQNQKMSVKFLEGTGLKLQDILQVDSSINFANTGEVLAFNSTTNKFVVSAGGGGGGGGGGLNDVVDDTSPQLGGDLDVNNFDITSNNDIDLDLGDDAGANYFRVYNSLGTSQAAIDSNGNLFLKGTVDGRDIATDGTKLDGIETGATADQTDAEIRTAVENATNSNVFTDADHSKLDGIEAGADVTDDTNVDAAGAVMENDYDAFTILAANSDNNPTILTVTEGSLIGRSTGGNIDVIASGLFVSSHSDDGKLSFGDLDDVTDTANNSNAITPPDQTTGVGLVLDVPYHDSGGTWTNINLPEITSLKTNKGIAELTAKNSTFASGPWLSFSGAANTTANLSLLTDSAKTNHALGVWEEGVGQYTQWFSNDGSSAQFGTTVVSGINNSNVALTVVQGPAATADMFVVARADGADPEPIRVTSNGTVQISNLEIITGGGEFVGGEHRLTQIADPVDDQDAVTKNYLDGALAASAVSGNYVLRDGTTSITGRQDFEDGLNVSSYIEFSAASPTHGEGRVYWDEDDKTLSIMTDQSDVTLQVGQEFYLRGVNKWDNGTIGNGSAVYVSGAQGQRPALFPATASGANLQHDVIGLATHDISKNSNGIVTTLGVVRGLNTSPYSAGDEIWLGDDLGSWSNSKPDINHVFIGWVLYSHATEGKIFVFPDVGQHLEDLHDVFLGSPTDNQLLKYDGSLSGWVNTSTVYLNSVSATTVSATDVTIANDLNVSGDILTNGTVTAVSGTGGSTLTTKDYVDSVAGGSPFTSPVEINYSSSTTPSLTISSTDDSTQPAASPIIDIISDRATVADGDYLGQIKWKGNSDTGTERVFAKMTGKCSDVTNGTEDGLLEFAVQKAGSQTIVLRIAQNGIKPINGTDIDMTNGGTVTDLPTPTADGDAAPKSYVDSVTVSDVWVRDIPIHGNSIYYNGSVFTAANPGVINNTDFDSAAAILQMAAAADRAGHYQFRVCEDLDVSEDIKLFLMFNLTGSPGASDTVVFDFNGRARGNNESFGSGGHLFSTVTTTTTIGSSGSNHSSGDLLEIDQGVVIPGGTLTYGDFVTFTVMRDVSADSFGGNTQMLGMTLLGTKRKLA